MLSAPLGDLLLTIALGVVGYFLLSLLATGAWFSWCMWKMKQVRETANRRAFEDHADRELREHLRVVGGDGIPARDRWAA